MLFVHHAMVFVAGMIVGIVVCGLWRDRAASVTGEASEARTVAVHLATTDQPDPQAAANQSSQRHACRCSPPEVRNCPHRTVIELRRSTREPGGGSAALAGVA
ncbi:hypothetical protein GCM10010452_84790 [Crossiella cryophila]